MDIDIPDDTPLSSEPQPPVRHLTVPVDDAHPFDLDSYISNYTGAQRSCPSRYNSDDAHCFGSYS
jgi:hypothetical protein